MTQRSIRGKNYLLKILKYQISVYLKTYSWDVLKCKQSQHYVVIVYTKFNFFFCTSVEKSERCLSLQCGGMR